MAVNNNSIYTGPTTPGSSLSWNPPTSYNGRPAYSTPDHILAGSTPGTPGSTEFILRNSAVARDSSADLPSGLPTTPSNTDNINPFGGVRTYGGGGSGGGGSTQPDFTPWGGWAAQAQPGMYSYTPLDLPDYNAPAFYGFDSGQYDAARQGIKTGIADSRKRGNTAFDMAAQRYLGYQDPYAGGPQTYSPGVDPRLLDSMAAWGGAGSGAAAQTWGEGVQADGAMRSVYDLLSNVGRQFNDQQLAGVEGDRMQMNQGLDASANMMNLSVDMKLAQAKSQYEKDKWLYGKEVADRKYEIAVAEAMQNNKGINDANQLNTQTTNAWNQSVMDAILQMIAADGKNIPQPGNELSKLITMPAPRSVA